MRLQQAVNAQILRAYQQLASSMDLQESEFNTLARELYSTENPALRGHRGNLSHLQVFVYVDIDETLGTDTQRLLII